MKKMSRIQTYDGTNLSVMGATPSAPTFIYNQQSNILKPSCTIADSSNIDNSNKSIQSNKTSRNNVINSANTITDAATSNRISSSSLANNTIEHTDDVKPTSTTQSPVHRIRRRLPNSSFNAISFLLPLISETMGLLREDSFSTCFESRPVERWNWNAYLFPLWCIGVIVRYFILFPIRLLILIIGFIAFTCSFICVKSMLPPSSLRTFYEKRCISALATCFMMSWTAVVKYHGVRPPRGRHQIYVANHSSMIDLIILMPENCFAAVGQKHPGAVGFLQDFVIGCLGCIWFNRSETKDRSKAAERIKQHVSNPRNQPLLIFPEGTCVNNEYVVMFKKGAFELNCTVYPIAIKYNKLFADAFWNSRQESFFYHLFRFMTGWALVCDVWYLDPVTQKIDETSEAFAERVRSIIAAKAGLDVVEWDGYLKYNLVKPRAIADKQKQLATIIRRHAFIEEIDETIGIGTNHRGRSGSI